MNQPASLGMTAPKPASLASTFPRRGMLCVLAGPAGCGKTTWATHWPSPEAIIDPRDQGIIDLIYEEQVSLTLDKVHMGTDYDSYKGHLAAGVDGPSKTLILESISGVQALCYEKASKVDYDNDMSHKKFLNYQNGPITAAEKYFQALLDLMLKAQNKGKHVIFIGHTMPKQTSNLEGDDYLNMVLGADKQMTLKMKASFMNIFIIAHAPVIQDGRGPTKADSLIKRWFFAHENAKYPSKNRMGITGEFEFPRNGKDAYLKFCQETKRDPKTGYRKA